MSINDTEYLTKFLQLDTTVVGKDTVGHKGNLSVPASVSSITPLPVRQQEVIHTSNNISNPAGVSNIRDLGIGDVVYSNDTLFRLPTIGTFDFTLSQRTLTQEQYSNNLFRFPIHLVSKRQSVNFDKYSGQVFVDVVNSHHNINTLSVDSRSPLSISSWWLFVVMVVISGIYVAFQRIYGRFFNLLFLGSINIREAERFFSSKTSHYSRILAISNILLVASLGLAIFNYLSQISTAFDANIKSFSILILIIVGYLLYRNILVSLFSFVSNLKEFFSTLSFHNFIFNFVITLILLLSAILSAYLPLELRLFPLYISLLIISIILILKTIRILKLFILNRFSIFYWILYFCALELLPLAFLIYGFKRLVIIA